MELIRKLLFSNTADDKLKLKYDKQEKTWIVRKGGSILYLGSEEQCKKYIAHHTGQQK